MEKAMLAYRVKVEVRTDTPTTYLWGSSRLAAKSSYFNNVAKNGNSQRLFLHFRNSEDGEAIVVSTSTIGKDPEVLGTFEPGEAFTVVLDNIIGVSATVKSPVHSYVDCVILTGH